MTPRTGTPRRLASDRPTESQFLSGIGELTLRISGPGQSGRLVRIHSAKCTVGSAKGCTLRLVARGVDGLECWILRGSGGTVIRRFGGALQLNGAHFDEALLADGDKLSVGPVEIVVEECGSAVIADRPASALTIGHSTHVLNLEARLDLALEQVRRLEAESRQGFESSITAADRADQLRDALTAANEQLEDVAEELSAAQALIDQQSRELISAQETMARHAAERTAADEAGQRQLHERQSSETELSELNAKIATAHDTINRLTTELSAEQAKSAALQSAELNGAETIAKLEAELATSRSQHESLVNELRGERDAIAAQRMQWDREHAAAIQHREDQDRELNILRERLDAKSAEITAISHQQTTSQALEARLAAQQQQLKQREAETNVLQQRAAVAEAEAGALRQSLQEQTELQVRIVGFSADLAAKNQQLEEARQAIAALNSQLAHTGDLQEERAAIEQEKTILADRESQFVQSTQDLADRENQLAESLRVLAEKRAALATDAEQVAIARQKLADQEQRLFEKALQVEQAQQAIQSQQAHSGAVEAEVATLREKLQEQAELQSRIDTSAAELIAKNQELDEARQAVAALTSQLAQVGPLDENKAAIEQQKSVLADREAQLAESARCLQESQAALAAEAQQLALVKQKLADKEQQLSEAALQIEQAQQALQTQAMQSSDLDLRVSEFELRATEIANRMADLDKLLEQLVDERASLTGREQNICHRERDFDERVGDLNRQAEQFQVRREQLEEREAQLQEREAATAIRATEVALRQTSLDVMQTTCHDSTRLSDNIAKQPHDASNDELHQTIVTSTQSAGEAAREDAQPTDESADVNSVLGRLASAGVLRDSHESQPPTMAEPQPAPPRFVAATEDIAPSMPRMPQKQTAGDEEESIESYMERLMQRVRGDSEPAPTGVTQTRASQTGFSQTGVSKTASKPLTSSFAAPPAEDVGSTMVAAIMPDGSAEGEPASAEIAPRRVVHDLTANLSAMRELANSAANAAINQHARNKSSQRAQRKLLGSCLTLGASAVLAYFSWESESTPGMAGATSGVAIAMYWMLGAARGFIGLKIKKSQALPVENEPAAEKPAANN
jgi:chromosome segregation ATPase